MRRPARISPRLTFALIFFTALAAGAQPEPRQAWAGDGFLCLAAVGSAARLDYPDGRTVDIPLPARSELTALAALRDGWIAGGARLDGEGQRRLVLFAGDRSGVLRLAEPPNPRGEGRVEPLPLVTDGELVGLAWMEGADDRSLAVYAATRQGEGWGRPERVAAQGPGSQLALAGAVLADGSWLLVWAGYDGRDDEIWWSLRRAGSWSPPERVAADNAVPDITPALVRSGNGALLSWSRRVGWDYRVQLARFDGKSWQAESQVGEVGSVFPSFVADAGGVQLLYRTARPRAWVVLDLDASGAAGKRVSLAAESLLRPLLLPATLGREKLVWPGLEAELLLPR